MPGRRQTQGQQSLQSYSEFVAADRTWSKSCPCPIPAQRAVEGVYLLSTSSQSWHTSWGRLPNMALEHLFLCLLYAVVSAEPKLLALDTEH